MGKAGIILLVDDDPSILQMVGDRLTMEGYTVKTATRGEQALEALKSITPDLIILDISMPGLGGLGFLRRMTDLTPPPASPILVFTGRHELASFFTDNTVTAFLPKTTHPDVFIQKVNALVAAYQAATQPATPPPTDKIRKKVLLVEDDFSVRSHLHYFFARRGLDVEPMDGGHTLLETATRTRPDIVLIKYLLPYHNGPELAQQLGGHNATRHIPVVLYDETGMHSSLLKHPGVRSLVPSVKDHILLKTVHDILGLPPAGSAVPA